MNRQHVPHYFINQVVSELGESCEALFNDLNAGNIRDFLKDIISTEFMSAKTNEIRRDTNKLAQDTKKRWTNHVTESINSNKKTKKKTELLKEVELLENLIEMYGSSELKKLQDVDTIEDLIKKRLREIETWCLNVESRLIDYKYIRDKTPTQILRAIRYDSIIAIADILIKNFKGNLNKIIATQPLKIIDHPVSSTNSKKIDLSNESVLINDKLHYISQYNPGENYSLLTFVSEDLISEEKMLRSLDNRDLEIIRTIISMSNRKLFFEERKISILIGDIVRAVFVSDSKQNYLAVKERLRKMANIRFNVIEPNKIHVFGIIENLKVVPELGGEIAHITMNEEIHKNYVKDQVIRTYSDRLRYFENKASESLIFPLQKERFLCYFRQQHSYCVELDYTYFIHKVQFQSKRKDLNLSLVDKCLQDFVNQRVTVESYERKKDTFYIKFFPVESYEVEDLLGNQQLSNFTEDSPEQLSLSLEQ